MVDPFDLAGRTALVTGATRGIGFKIAETLVHRGARVIGHGSSEHSVEAAKLNLPNVEWVAQDLGKKDAAKTIAANCSASAQVDILVMNAAMQTRQPPSEVTSEAFQSQMNVNLRSNLGLLQALLPGMAQVGWGRVVTIGSIQQFRPNPELAVYSASKSALKTMALAMTRPYFGSGVTVNNIAAGLIDTDRNADIKADAVAYAEIVDRIPARIEGTTSDVANMVLFLVSEAGRYVIGADIPVDGGAHIPR